MEKETSHDIKERSQQREKARHRGEGSSNSENRIVTEWKRTTGEGKMRWQRAGEAVRKIGWCQQGKQRLTGEEGGANRITEEKKEKKEMDQRRRENAVKENGGGIAETKMQ